MEKDVVVYIIGGILTFFLAIISWLGNKIFQLLKDVFENFKQRLDATDTCIDEHEKQLNDINEKVNNLEFIHEKMCPVKPL